MESLRSWWDQRWLPGLILVVAVFLVYQPAWHAGFIWDDDFHLTKNPCIVGPLGFKAIWTSSAALYYPLVLSSFWVQHALWDLHPLPYHLVNIAAHVACAFLLWQVLRSLNVRWAWLGAALWALHPVQVESVAWITELKNTQSCLFYLLAILFFLKWQAGVASGERSGNERNYALALLWALLAILSKASTVMLPVVLGLCCWWRDWRWHWRNGLRLAPFFLISAVASGWTIWEQKFHSGARGTEWAQSGSERLVISGKVVWFYLGKLLWPHPLIFIYPRWTIDASKLTAYLPVLAVAMGLFVLWWNRDRWMRPLYFGFAYFLVSLFPVLGFFNVFFFRYSFVGDHFQYLAGMGPLALGAAGLATAAGLLGKRKLFLEPALGAMLLLLLGILTWRQTWNYTDSRTLWLETLARNPNAYMAHGNLGWVLLEQGQVDDALAHFQKALELRPDDAVAHNDFGAALLRKGRFNEAVAQFREALNTQPADASAQSKAHNNLGWVFRQNGQLDEAMTHFQKALEFQPGSAETHNNFGLALLQRGRVDEAIAQFQQALAIQPELTEAHNGLGSALLQQGKMDEALAQFQTALKHAPGSAETQNNVGWALLQKGRLDAAIAHFESALKIQPGLPQAHNNLAIALLRKGQVREAIAQYQTSLELRPNDARTLSDLAWVLATSPEASIRNGARAVELAQNANRLSGDGDLVVLRTLAAAYAEAGRFPEAIETTGRALSLIAAQANTVLADALRAEIRFYQAGQPFRDMSQAPVSN